VTLRPAGQWPPGAVVAAGGYLQVDGSDDLERGSPGGGIAGPVDFIGRISRSVKIQAQHLLAFSTEISDFVRISAFRADVQFVEWQPCR